jgi:hypothetical protein
MAELNVEDITGSVTGGFRAMIGRLEADIQANQARIMKLEEAQAAFEQAMTDVAAVVGPVNGNGAAAPAAGTPKPGKKAQAKARAAEKGQSSALFLAGFDRRKSLTLDEVRAATGQMGRNIGVLIRHGYLKRKGDGYVRTAKTLEG